MELSTFTDRVQPLPALYKKEVEAGDCIMVKTRNSVYTLRILNEKDVLVRGGHFERRRESPVRTSVTGCGMGSAFVKVDLLAACGLRLEFGNRVVTSTITAFVIFKAHQLN